MLNAKTLNSLKVNLMFRAAGLTLILILYLIFIYVIHPYIHNNSNDLAQSFVIEMTDIFSIVLLSLILLISGSLVLTMTKILKFKANLDSDLEVEINSPSANSNKHLDKSKADIIRNERLYTMGNLAAGIIHDFKNPISNISLCVQAIMNGFAEGDKREFYLKKIEDQIDRMLNMTQDFLDYAQGQKSVKIQEIEFTETIKNQIEFHRQKSEKKHIGLYYSLPEPFYIKIDVHKFRRVLDNIVTNAFEVLKSDEFININISTDESGFKMEISDNGPGIFPEVLPRIFEPFFTYGKSKGSGLGLSISKKIVEDHGGTLTVKSEIGKGTCFTITLPSELICRSAPQPISEKSGAIAS